MKAKTDPETSHKLKLLFFNLCLVFFKQNRRALRSTKRIFLTNLVFWPCAKFDALIREFVSLADAGIMGVDRMKAFRLFPGII